jgi:proteasome-associated ATPase
VIFFDEMDSLFRMRGSGISSDMEATVVAQFLSEIDGVESLNNVIVIGASNRQDLIDPAVLRPGRLDLKIKVHRPDAKAAREIFSKYLMPDLPFHASAHERYGNDSAKIVESMINDTIDRMVPDQRGQQVPRGDVREGRPRDVLLQGLLQRRHDREHRGPRQEVGAQAVHLDR